MVTVKQNMTGELNLKSNECEKAIYYGNFIQSIVNFLLIALVIFTVVKAINSFHRKNDKPIEEPAPEEPSEEVLLLREIRDMLAKDHK